LYSINGRSFYYMEKFADKIRQRAPEDQEDLAAQPDEAGDSIITPAIVYKFELCWTKALDKEWGCWTPLGKATTPGDLLINSHAEYVAVCEIRYKKRLHEQRKRDKKSKVIEGRFKTLTKKALGRRPSKS